MFNLALFRGLYNFIVPREQRARLQRRTNMVNGRRRGFAGRIDRTSGSCYVLIESSALLGIGRSAIASRFAVRQTEGA